MRTGCPHHRQHLRHAVSLPALRVGCRHRRPLGHEVHRGHGTSIGVIVDSGKFDWTNGALSGYWTRSKLHGLRYVEALGPAAYIVKARTRSCATSACLSPFNSFLFLQGLETLSLRMERHSQNALAVARFSRPIRGQLGRLSRSRKPRRTSWPKSTCRRAGAILSFGLKRGRGRSKFIDRLELFSLLANVGDAKSLVIHPATTTHQQLTPEEQGPPASLRVGPPVGGARRVDDLIADLDQALSSLG